MVLGEVVGKVQDALVPVDVEMTIVGPVLYPKVPHCHGFGAANLDGAIGNAGGSGIVSLHRGGALREAELFEGGANGLRVTAVVEEAAKLCFSGRGNDFFEFVRCDVDCPIEERRRITSCR